MTATTTTTGAARPSLMRTLNEQLLLERMRGNGPVSRSDLAGASGLSKPTVALALTSLERDALVRHAGRRVGGRGRSASLYEIRSDAGFVLGLDVGREFVRGAVTDLAGAVRARRSRPARSSSGAARVRELAALADDLLQDGGRRRQRNRCCRRWSAARESSSPTATRSSWLPTCPDGRGPRCCATSGVSSEQRR